MNYWLGDMNMTFQPELLDQLLQGYEKPEDLLGEGGILKQLTKALVERCLEAEMKTHLEGQKPQTQAPKPANRRNGHSKKTIKGEFGEAEIAVPRDRDSEFEPIIVKKHQTRFEGFDDKILSLYARGMSTRDIVLKNHRAFPSDESALKVVYLAIENISKKWTMPIRDWRPALNRFAIMYDDRFPV